MYDLWRMPLYMIVLHNVIGSSGGVVVKLLACGAEGRGSIPGLAATISEIGYLLLPSRDMAERSLKRRKSSKQPNPTIMSLNLGKRTNVTISISTLQSVRS